MAEAKGKTGIGGKIAVVAVLTIVTGAVIYLGVKMSKMAKEAKEKQDAIDKEVQESASATAG